MPNSPSATSCTPAIMTQQHQQRPVLFHDVYMAMNFSYIM